LKKIKNLRIKAVSQIWWLKILNINNNNRCKINIMKMIERMIMRGVRIKIKMMIMEVEG
jgi:hypothetical protein